MFKEQLHTSFDSISPSPELLDRVSAMMSEEVSRKKPPIYMNAVKYGGIAAALAIAACGTLLALNMNSGVQTAAPTETTVAAAEAAPEMKIASDEDAGAVEAAYAPPMPDETTAAAGRSGMVDEDKLVVSGTPEAWAVTTTAPENEPERFFAEETMPAETVAADVTEAPVSTPAEPLVPEEPIAPDNMIAPEMIVEQNADKADEPNSFIIQEVHDGPDPVNADENSSDDAVMAEDVSEDECDDLDADFAYFDDNCLADNIASEEAPESNEAAGMAADSIVTTAVSDLSRGTIDMFYLPFEDVINGIPGFIGELREHADWARYGADQTGIDGIGSYANIYTFINDFSVTREEIEKAKTAAGTEWLTGDQLDVLYSGNIAEITAVFATPVTIVKGEKAYSPFWLMSHEAADYEAAGITAADIEAVRPYIVDTRVISDDEKTAFIAKLDEFIAKARDTAPKAG